MYFFSSFVFAFPAKSEYSHRLNFIFQYQMADLDKIGGLPVSKDFVFVHLLGVP